MLNKTNTNGSAITPHHNSPTALLTPPLDEPDSFVRSSSDPPAIIGAALLGDLEYDHIEDEWVINLGGWLGIAKAAFDRDDQGSRRSVILARRLDARRTISSICLSRGITLVDDLSGIFGRDSSAAVQFIHRAVLRAHGASALAVVCIAQCVVCLAQNRHLHENTLDNRMKLCMDVINHYCPQLRLSTDGILRTIREQLDPPRLLDTLGVNRILVQLSRPLKVLLMASEPRDHTPIDHVQEYLEIGATISEVRFAESLQLSAVPGCRTRDISAALDKH